MNFVYVCDLGAGEGGGAAVHDAICTASNTFSFMPPLLYHNSCMHMQFKPAEEVLRRYYRATQPRPDTPTASAKCIGDGKCTC